MNRITSFLALSAIVVAGAFSATAAQASANNVIVDFTVHNADSAESMIRSGSLPSTFSGLITPPSAIGPGGDDPSSGYAQFIAPAPAVGHSVQGSLTYVDANLMNVGCTFTITVSRSAPNSYGLAFSVSNNGTHCSVPAGGSNSDGLFTTSSYTLSWST